MIMNSSEIYDVLIIGAGPGGTSAAIRLANAGHSVLVVDRQTFPRFRIGESLLPHTQGVLRELGVLDRVKAQPHVIKRGLEIGFGSGTREPAAISFDEIMGESEKLTFNIRGECLDQALADGAIEAGAIGEGVLGLTNSRGLRWNVCHSNAGAIEVGVIEVGVLGLNIYRRAGGGVCVIQKVML